MNYAEERKWREKDEILIVEKDKINLIAEGKNLNFQ